LAVSLTMFSTRESTQPPEVSKPFKTLRRCTISEVPVDCITLENAAKHIITALRQPSIIAPFLIMGPNAQLITLAQKDPRLYNALLAAALNVPDGISVVLASRLLGNKIDARAPGGELMELLCRDAAMHGLSAFFLGGLPEAASGAALQLQRRYPGLYVAGAYCPPLGFENDPIESVHVREVIAEAAPDLLFVALGAPKQEIWMHENCPTLPIGAAMSVGAAFDTQAGLRKRAPGWTHKVGLEWLYRFAVEPRRLWRRYLIGNAQFIYLVLRQRFLWSVEREDPSTLPPKIVHEPLSIEP